MFLKTLTLKGFKSFVDRTSMTFDPGLTVVVGPNGSGKSNISDAILWVLGEQSAKMLRGDQMEDVIFTGSTARPPAGLAEVSLVLDNSDHTIPIDFEEVGITRRMYRSGVSEYLINGAPARLRDIQDILHDTGLGKETHSIISQGKLDTVLSGRPEDRRELIEEAAGISKHRRRKERSQRKLKSMDENLVRAKDIAREIGRQLRPLERQVERARQANELQARHDELTTILAVDDLRRLQTEHTSLSTQSTEADAAVELAQYRLGERQAELDKLQAMLEQKGLFVGDLGEQRRRMQDILGRIDSDMRLLEEKGKNMVARLSETRRSISGAEHARTEAAAEIERITAELGDLNAQAKQLDERIAELDPQVSAARNSLTELDSEQERMLAELRQARKTADDETIAYARLQEQISGAELEDSMFASRISQLDETLATTHEALESARERKAVLRDEQQQARDAEAKLQTAIEGFEQAHEQAQEATRASRLKLSETQAALAALQAVETDALSPRVSALREKGAWQHVENRLGDLLEVPAELEAVVAQLLGADIDTLVVSGSAELRELASEALRIHDAEGRAAMLARSATQVPRSAVTGTRLIERLSVHAGAESLIEALLGDVVLVESLDEALAAHSKDSHFVYATASAAVVLRDGRVVVGGDVAAQGSLERKGSIRKLQLELPGFEEALQAAVSQSEQTETDLNQSRNELLEKRSELARLSAELNSCEAEIVRLSTQCEQAENERSKVEKRRAEAADNLNKIKPELEGHQEAAHTAEKQAQELSSRLDELITSRDEARQESERLRASLAELRLDHARVVERSTHLSLRNEEQTRRLNSARKSIETLERSARALEVLRLRVSPLYSRYEAIAENAHSWAARLRDQASLAEADSDSLKKTIGEARQGVQDASSVLDEAREQSQEAKLALSRIEVQVQTAINAIVGDGSKSLDDALELPEPEDRAASERELARLVRQLAEIGPVNQVAMDEYTRLKERADHINEQVADLEQARQSLVKIMAAIDRKMRKAFLETFEAVNLNFGAVFSMLFPGGQAKIELTDPEHLAETGIEVIAQPRGKRLAKMTLMSGGERSLTALALLFAVYRTRTVPFYVFDEVEAALDDSNLDKLLGAIEQLKETTQLIVISHQRRTMEQADVLYGVSMQADGVSRVVSQKLDKSSGKVVDA